MDEILHHLGALSWGFRDFRWCKIFSIIPSEDPVTTGAEPRGRSGTFICTAPAPNGGGSGDVMVGIEEFGI